MARYTFLMAMLLGSVGMLWAQKPDKDGYYTGSEVDESALGLGFSVSPYYSNRRLLSNTLNPGQAFQLIDNATEGQWGLGFGPEVYIALSDRFEVVTGVQWGTAGFRYPRVELENVILGLDSGFYALTEEFQFVNVPIGLAFRSQLNDEWYLDVTPAIELSWLTKYDLIYEAGGVVETSDALPLAEDFFSWLSLTIGGTYSPFETWGYSVRFGGRYMLNSLIQRSDYPREVLYTIGGSVGVQYRF